MHRKRLLSPVRAARHRPRPSALHTTSRLYARSRPQKHCAASKQNWIFSSNGDYYSGTVWLIWIRVHVFRSSAPWTLANIGSLQLDNITDPCRSKLLWEDGGGRLTDPQKNMCGGVVFPQYFKYVYFFQYKNKFLLLFIYDCNSIISSMIVYFIMENIFSL